MGRRIGAPHFRLPGNISQELSHGGAVRKCGHKYEARHGAVEQFSQFVMPLGVYRSVTCDEFDEKQPVLAAEIERSVGHLAVPVDIYSEVGKALLFKISNFVFRIANIDDLGSRDEASRKLVNEVFDKFAVGTGGKRNSLARRQRNRKHLHMARLGPFGQDCLLTLQEGIERSLPGFGAEGLDHAEGFVADPVAGFRTIDGSGGIVGIVDGDAGFHELVHCLTPVCFARVRLVLPAIVFPNIVHDRRNTHQGAVEFAPRTVGLEVENGKQSKCRAFILLAARHAESFQNLQCLVDLPLSVHRVVVCGHVGNLLLNDCVDLVLQELRAVMFPSDSFQSRSIRVVQRPQVRGVDLRMAVELPKKAVNEAAIQIKTKPDGKCSG